MSKEETFINKKNRKNRTKTSPKLISIFATAILTLLLITSVTISSPSLIYAQPNDTGSAVPPAGETAAPAPAAPDTGAAPSGGETPPPAAAPETAAPTGNETG